MQTMIIAYIIQWIVLIILMILIYRLMKVIGKYLNHLNTFSMNSNRAPTFDKTGPKLNSISPKIHSNVISDKSKFINSEDIIKNSNILLLFLAPRCGTCEKLLNDISIINKYKGTRIIGVIKTEGVQEQDIYYYSEQLKALNIDSISLEAIPQSYRINFFPYGILINKSHIIIAKDPVHNEKTLIEIINTVQEDETA
ncbi:MAG: hypothetical protein ACQEWU_21100 [Bacillota bacterium]